MKYSKYALAALLITATGSFGLAQSPDSSSAKPDNTAVNKGDEKSGAVTADQQKSNPADRALTQKIRRSIVADKSLSTYAHNVKIISQNGSVTLKGPVQSEDEKKAVVAKAVAIAGDPEKVIDKVTVKQ